MKFLYRRNKLRIPPPVEHHAQSSWETFKFDEITGQVYSERTAAIQISDDGNWTQWHNIVALPTFDGTPRCDGGKRVSDLRHYEELSDDMRTQNGRSRKGARSLQHSAIESILQNISSVTLEGIEYLPVHLARRIWHAVNKKNLISFNTWKIFSKVLRHDIPSPNLLNYSRTIHSPRSSLHIYTAPLTSKSLDFITSLSITVALPIPDLLRLSDIPNLGILEIINLTKSISDLTEPSIFGVGDRLIRAWHLAATNNGAFPVLRILRLWNYENLTGQSLIFLNSFPALAVYDVAGCGFEFSESLRPRRLGWTPIVDTNLTGTLEAACMERIILMRDRLGVQAKSIEAVDSQHSLDWTKTRLIPRADVLKFLIQSKLSSMSDLNGQHRDLNHHSWDDSMRNRSRRGTERSRTQTEENQLPGCKTVDIWEDLTNKIFPRVGELRSDADFVRAGVDIGDQAIIGDTLVNSIPMASLRLGSPYSATSTLRALAFVRINLPSTANAATKQDGNETSAEDTRETSLLYNTKRKQQGQCVVRTKRRKLNDFLDSFL